MPGAGGQSEDISEAPNDVGVRWHTMIVLEVRHRLPRATNRLCQLYLSQTVVLSRPPQNLTRCQGPPSSRLPFLRAHFRLHRHMFHSKHLIY